MKPPINKLKDFFKERPGVVALYLFGSHARERARKTSDVDVAVLFRAESIPTARAALDLQEDLSAFLGGDEVDLIVMNRANPILKHQIYKYGRLLFEGDVGMASRFFVRASTEYADLKRVRAPIEAALLRGRTYG